MDLEQPYLSLSPLLQDYKDEKGKRPHLLCLALTKRLDPNSYNNITTSTYPPTNLSLLIQCP